MSLPPTRATGIGRHGIREQAQVAVSLLRFTSKAAFAEVLGCSDEAGRAGYPAAAGSPAARSSTCAGASLRTAPLPPRVTAPAVLPGDRGSGTFRTQPPPPHLAGPPEKVTSAGEDSRHEPRAAPPPAVPQRGSRGRPSPRPARHVRGAPRGVGLASAHGASGPVADRGSGSVTPVADAATDGCTEASEAGGVAGTRRVAGEESAWRRGTEQEGRRRPARLVQ